jgi:putative endonuclease
MPYGYTYIMGSASGTLYIGVTSQLDVRVRQHRNGTFKGFATKYGCTRLLYYEVYDDIRLAIGRETELKGWRRERKLDLIRTVNPEFKDLAEQLDWQRITRHERMHPE